MTDRVILADCCEDWILEWGAFYPAEGAFACPECGTEWTKPRAASFKRRTDAREFERRERRGASAGAAFPYLAAADGVEPNVERCCAKILLTHGSRMREGAFVCPVCRAGWEKRTEKLHGLRVPVFEREGLAGPLTIQPGRTRPFLVGVEEYSPPRD
jgi:hypothetical protein